MDNLLTHLLDSLHAMYFGIFEGLSIFRRTLPKRSLWSSKRVKLPCWHLWTTAYHALWCGRLKREEDRIAREMAEKEEEEARAVLEQAAKSGKIKLPVMPDKLDKAAILNQVRALLFINLRDGTQCEDSVKSCMYQTATTGHCSASSVPLLAVILLLTLKTYHHDRN